jgi:hypothetical protein
MRVHVPLHGMDWGNRVAGGGVHYLVSHDSTVNIWGTRSMQRN